MHIYLVRRMDNVGYDEVSAVVVRAKDALTARYVAASVAQDEGEDIWMHPGTEVERIFQGGFERVILVQTKDG